MTEKNHDQLEAQLDDVLEQVFEVDTEKCLNELPTFSEPVPTPAVPITRQVRLA